MMKKCKRCIKAALRLILKRNIEDIKKQIDEVDVVYFDLFDTLVLRRGKLPESIFRHMAEDLKENGGYPENRDFYRDRIGIENRLRNESLGEITFGQIYSKFLWINDTEKEELAEKEIATEIEDAYQDEKGKALFQYAIKHGKEVVITSDMYLPIEAITGILDKTGYKGWSKIFLSSEYGTTKNNKLYNFVLDVYNGKKLLHIGDDVKTDLISAEKAGIKSVLA